MSTAIEQLVVAGLAESGSRLQEHQAYGGVVGGGKSAVERGVRRQLPVQPGDPQWADRRLRATDDHPEAFAPACGGSLWSWDRAEAERAIRLALVVRFAWVLPDLLRATADGRAVLGGRPLTEVAGPWEAVAWLVADAASALRDAGRAGW